VRAPLAQREFNPLQAMRLKRAYEGAIRASITQFLDRLRTMK
jgi:hypothetical protein